MIGAGNRPDLVKLTIKQGKVVNSILKKEVMHVQATFLRPSNSEVECHAYNVEAGGSNPSLGTTTSKSVGSLKEEEIMSDIKQVIVVRKDLNMRKGKMCAQVAHASMKFLTDNNEAERGDEMVVKLSPVEAEWLTGSFTKVVVSVDSQDALEDLMLRAQLEGVECHHIIDAGKTEFNGVPTLTCAAFGPCESHILDKLTGNLKLI